MERALLALAEGRPQLGLAAVERLRREVDGQVLAPVIEDRMLAVEVRSFLAVGEVDRAASLVAGASLAGAPELAGAVVQVALAASGPAGARAALETLVRARGRAAGGASSGRSGRRSWTWRRATGAGRSIAPGWWSTPPRRRATSASSSTPDLTGERLVRALASQRPGPYVARLVRAASLLRPVTGSGPSGLSERELEIVRYLPTSLSNAEIAAALFVSLNTLKTHLRTIYRKLGVRGREDAIERAQGLGVA